MGALITRVDYYGSSGLLLELVLELQLLELLRSVHIPGEWSSQVWTERVEAGHI